MIAGFLFNTNKFHSLSYFLKHRSIQLLIPYISFFTFFYISWLLFGRDWIGGNELDIPLWKPLMEFAYGTPVTIIAPYWFICCLFSMQIIYYLLIRQFPKPIVIIIVSICPLYIVFHGLLIYLGICRQHCYIFLFMLFPT